MPTYVQFAIMAVLMTLVFTLDTEVRKSVKVSPAKVFVFHHPTFSEEDDPLVST